mgnify:CR=1 FL=1
MTPPSITATGSQPFQTYSRIKAPEVSLYSAIRRPWLSKTEWIVTGVGEVRVRIAWRPIASYLYEAWRTVLIRNSDIRPAAL